MTWSVAQAKQKLSEVLRSAASEPQTIVNRSRPVAVVVSPEVFQEFVAWRARRDRWTVGEAFAELRELAGESGYELRLPARANRRDGSSGVRR